MVWERASLALLNFGVLSFADGHIFSTRPETGKQTMKQIAVMAVSRAVEELAYSQSNSNAKLES